MGDTPAEGQCHFYLVRKHRYCRFQPKEGQQYCPEHACIKNIQGDRKRVPCPLNPSHNCYEDDLEKHIKKCNVTKLQQATEQAGYYVKGINTGSKDGLDEKQNKKVCVKDLTSADLASMIVKIDKLYKEHVEKIETAIYEHPCIREHFCTSANGDLDEVFKAQAALRKELLQQASLVGQLDKLGLLDSGHYFVEMGAGKGKLSHWIQQASKEKGHHSFLLVERGSVRYKMDSFHKLGGDDSKFKRIRIDIGDLCLGRVSELQSTDSVIVIGKHLCGGATDMGIRCGIETLELQIKQDTCSDNSHPTTSRLASSTSDLTSSANKASSTSNPTSQTTATFSETLEAKIDESSTSEANQISEETCPDSRKKSSEISSGSRSVHPSASTEQQFSRSRSDHTTTGTEDGEAVNDHKRTITVAGTAMISTGPDCVQEPPCKSPKLEKNVSQNKRLPAGIMIALCCHHRCTWDSYLGKDFMLACGLTPQDFDLLTRLSSWATCAKVTGKTLRKSGGITQSNVTEDKEDSEIGQKREEKDQDQREEDHKVQDLVQLKSSSQSLREQLSVQEREDIGRKCKRLIDTGRLHYLRSKGMECFLREYVNEDLTPENIVLIAHTPRS